MPVLCCCPWASPPRRPPPPGQDRWGALLLESREPQPGLQKYSSALDPSRLEADLLGALRTAPPTPSPFEHLGDGAYFTKWVLPSPEPTW